MFLNRAIGASSAEEEIGWDEDSDDEPSTPQPQASPELVASATTPKASKSLSEDDVTKPAEPRKSQDVQSQSGSDGSYDLVSGATSRAPGSPRDEKEKKAGKKDDSDEEDWE